jgi:uncharacterized protein
LVDLRRAGKMKKLSVIIALVLTFVLVLPTSIFAGSDNHDFVYDGADLLTDEEEASLEERIEMLTDNYKTHIVIVTVSDLGYNTAYSYADSYYHDNGFGYGKDKSGILLLLSMSERDYYIYTYGEAEDKFGDSELTQLEEAMLPCFDENRFYDGFVAFIDACDNVLTFDFFGSLLIASVVGIVIALVIVLMMKRKLKSVRPQKTASNYVRTGSFMLTKDLDLYLYRTVTRTRRAETSSGSRSSGGGSRGGGRGGKF